MLLGDAEEASIFLAPDIGLERFRVTGEQRGRGAPSCLKLMEATVEVDVVRQNDAARPQRGPRLIKFEQQISLGVLAVVDEQIDLLSVGKQSRQAVPARSPHVGPAVSKRIRYGHADLVVELWGIVRWQVDAPEMPFAVGFEGFERNARRYTPRNARLDNDAWLQVPHDTPHCPRKSWLAVAPTRERASAELHACFRHRLYNLRPQIPKIARERAWPRRTERTVQALLPIEVYVIRARRPRHEAPALSARRMLLPALEEYVSQVDQEPTRVTDKLSRHPLPPLPAVAH
jgi:hypothetical protein